MTSRRKHKTPGSERRRWPRMKASSVPFLKGAILGQGTEVEAIDISRGGMLVQTEVRLRPQMRVHLKLVTSDGVIKLEGSVLRSSICSLGGSPKYRSAIEFDNPFHMLDDLSEEPEAIPQAEGESGMRPEIEEGSNQLAIEYIDGKFDDNTASLTFLAPDIPGAALLERIRTNEW